MSACFEVFSTWDDEYDKLQGLLRDQVKKKREEHLRMVWRVNPAHKRLQARLDQMRRCGYVKYVLYIDRKLVNFSFLLARFPFKLKLFAEDLELNQDKKVCLHE